MNIVVLGPCSNCIARVYNKRTCIGPLCNGGSMLLAMACGSSGEVAIHSMTILYHCFPTAVLLLCV